MCKFSKKLDGGPVSYTKWTKGKEKKNCTNLADDLVEEAAGESLLDLLLEPPVRGPVGYVGLVGRAAAAGEQGDDATGPVEDDGSRIPPGGEGAALLVVGQDGGLDRRALDAVVVIDASERVQPVGAADGGARGQAVLHHQQCLLAIRVVVLGMAHLVILDDAKGLEEPIGRVLVVRLVLGLREQELAEVGRREFATCKITLVSQKKRKRKQRVGKKRTDVDLVSLKGGPVYLLLVELDKGPVTRKPVGSVGDHDGFRVEDAADDALVRVRPELGNLVVELVQGVDHLGRLLHLALDLQAPLGVSHVLAVDGFAQPLNHVLPHGDGASQGADSGHHGVCRVPVAHAAQRDDLLAGLAGALARHARVGKRGRRASNVGSGEEGDAVVVTAEAEIERAGALIVGRPERGDGEAERGREGLAELVDGVSEGVEREELRATHRARHLRLAESDLNLGEAGLAEDGLDGVGGSHCSLEGERLVLHADPHQERAKWRPLPGVGEGDGIDRCPLDAESIQGLVDVGTDLEPVACDGVTVDRARLADVALRLGTLGYRPGRTRLVDAGSPARRAEEVFVCGGVTVGETGRASDDAAPVDVGLVELVGREGSR